MVLHKQPVNLYKLCHEWFCQYLGDKVVNAGYDNNPNKLQTLSIVRHKLRPFFLEHIPVLVRTSLLEETSNFLFQKSVSSGVDCDYGRSVLHLVYLLLSKEIKRLKVTLCCYYGCRDMEGVLRCIKKYGTSLEHLELSRSSLLRMDPLLFRNVLTSANKLTSLVVKNICSDAMLKLIGTHCHSLQYLDISNSKQVSDGGIESLCCQVQIRDKRQNSDCQSASSSSSFSDSNSKVTIFRSTVDPHLFNVTVHEDFTDSGNDDASGVGCCGVREQFRKCFFRIAAGNSNYNQDNQCLVEVKQVLHPICGTLRVLDITDTSVTNVGLLIIFRKMSKLHSLGEYSLSDNFMRSLCAVSSLRMDKFGLTNLHTRKITSGGMYNLVYVFPNTAQLTCWEPQFDLYDLSYLRNLREVTLLRIAFSETMLQQLQRYIETCKEAANLEKISFEFILQDDYLGYNHRALVAAGGLGGGVGVGGAAAAAAAAAAVAAGGHPPGGAQPGGNNLMPGMTSFDLGGIFMNCHKLKIFTVEFKDSLLMTPPVGFHLGPQMQSHLFDTLVHVQLGQVIQNSAISAILENCTKLKHIHCNNCPDLTDLDISTSAVRAKSRNSTQKLECFYIYEAPQLTVDSFQILLEAFPNLRRFGNLTRWAVNCEGLQQVVRTIRDNNLDIEILCGSHWFSSKCALRVNNASS